MSEHNKDTIHRRLRLAREYAGLSQSQAAQIMHMHRPTISEIEAGRRRISTDELKQFSEMYDVDIDWLLNGETNENIKQVNEKVQLAARHMSKMKPNDFDKLMTLIQTFKQ